MNILDYIVQHARTIPNNAALKNNQRVITYNGLLECISSYSRYLLENVCSPGNVVILKSKEPLDWVIAFLSLLAIGCWVVPVSDKLSQYELDQIAEITHATTVIDEYSPKWEMAGITNYNDLFMFNEKSSGILHMTSGSTGKAKFCIRTIDNLTSEGLAFRTKLETSSIDKVLGVPPLYHSYALGAALMTALVSGSCLYTLDKFVPREVLRIVEEDRITILILVPIMAKLLCSTYTSSKSNLFSLRIALVGAGAITEDIYNGFLSKFGISLQCNYGSTETGGIVTRLKPEPRQSIGKPMEGVQIKIICENGTCVSENMEGELWVKCSSMLSGYYGIQSKCIDDDGYFPMGDIVVMDERGYLYLKGRKKNIINVGGKKVNPYEVEEVLRKIPGMKECVVIGFKKANGEEAVKAIVVSEMLTEYTIRKYCISVLSDFKVPSIIEFQNRLPRNELGKIRRKDLVTE